MRYFASFTFLVLMACGGIQTEPTCKVKEYGLVDVVNNTDEYKEVVVHRLIHDGERYKTVPNPFRRTIEPMTRGRIRIYPGLVLVVIHPVEGSVWRKVFQIRMCTVTTISLKIPVVLKDPEIRSRRARQ